MGKIDRYLLRSQGSWGQSGAHLSPVGPRLAPYCPPNPAIGVTRTKLNKAWTICIMHKIYCIYKLKEQLPHYRVVLQLFRAPSTTSKLLIKGRSVAIAVTTALLCYRKRATPSHDIRLHSWDSQVAAKYFGAVARKCTSLDAFRGGELYVYSINKILSGNCLSKIDSIAYMK